MPDPIPAPTKRCARCEIEKPREAFSLRTAAPDGLQRMCRQCRSEYHQERREHDIALGRAWREANIERDRENKRAYGIANAESKSAAARARYEANRDQVLAAGREWYNANRDRKQEKAREWLDANPERRAEHHRRRLEREKSAADGVIDREALWAEQQGFCGICASAIDERLVWPHPLSRSIDHVVPLVRGGAHSQENVQWTHLRCNQQKSTKLPDEKVVRDA